MKTKLTLTLALAASLFTTTTAQAQQPLDVLKTRTDLVANLTKILADYDAQWEAVLGADWKAKLADPKTTEAKVLVDAYIAKPFPLAFADRLPVQDSGRLIAHILAKPVLVTEDLTALQGAISTNPSAMKTEENTKLVDSRMDELMALQPKGTLLDMLYKKYVVLHGDPNWVARATISEWLALPTEDLAAEGYKLIQDSILNKATEALIEKKIKAGEVADGPDFDAAMAPVVTALNAPLFEGLAEALLPLGVKVTMPDYTAVVAKIPRLVAAIERRTVPESEARKTLGNVMFVKGVTAYNAWKTARAK